MTGAEIFALLKDGGPWGLLALVCWRWFKSLDDLRAADAARLQDNKEMYKEVLTTNAAMTHAMEKLEEVVKARP
jgi:hypothetical protein